MEKKLRVKMIPSLCFSHGKDLDTDEFYEGDDITITAGKETYSGEIKKITNSYVYIEDNLEIKKIALEAITSYQI